MKFNLENHEKFTNERLKSIVKNYMVACYHEDFKKSKIEKFDHEWVGLGDEKMMKITMNFYIGGVSASDSFYKSYEDFSILLSYTDLIIFS